MFKAKKEISKVLNSMDVLIEIVDARIPHSSQNPLIASWRERLPSIVVMNKMDLADEKQSQQWRQRLEMNQQLKVIPCQKGQHQSLKRLESLCHQWVPHKDQHFEPIHAIILGIPNVGKSTIINSLAKRPAAKVGDEPAVTRRQQIIQLNEQLVLHDTPGFLWPKLENQNSAYRLAMVGSIKNTAIEFEDVALFAAECLLQKYPERLMQRYKLSQTPLSAHECLEAIAKKRGGLRAGGHIDLHKASEVLIHDLRQSALGRVTLETPEEVEHEVALLAQEKALNTKE